MRTLLLVAATLAAGCMPVEPPGSAPPDEPAPEQAGPSLYQAPTGLLQPPFTEPPVDDDDVATDDDDDLPPLLQSPCPDPASPQPETPFVDVSICAAVQASSGAEPPIDINGEAWADVDGDGDLDLYLTDPAGPNTLLLNDGAGRFEPCPASGPMLPDHASSGASFVDYDNDGDPDLFVLARGANALLRNDGPDGWVDVAMEVGLDDPGHGMSAAWTDFDGDGELDVYVANYECVDCPWLPPDEVFDDRLFRGTGDGAFEEVSSWLDTDLLRGDGYAAAWLDFDNDGDPDLYVVNDRGHSEPWSPGDMANRNLLWRNDGPGCGGTCFAEIGQEVGVDLRIAGMGVSVGDYDHDGWLDMAVSDGGHPWLLRNMQATFVDVTIAAGLGAADVHDGWGLALLDFDNDGDLDLYQADGQQTQTPNWLFANQGDGTFLDISEQSGASETGHSTGLAVADYDRDGWLDLVIGNREGDYQLFRNMPVGDPHWLRVRLTGAGPGGRDALGARVSVEDAAGVTHVREVGVGAGIGASNDPALHFGLGSSEPVSIVVLWPDGATTSLGSPPTRDQVDLAHPNP